MICLNKHTFNINDINNFASSQNSNSLENPDKLYKTYINNILNIIVNNIEKYKILLISGASCTGKTLACKFLKNYLQNMGITAWSIPLDNFFFGSKQIPIKNGYPDYECLDSIDVKLVNQCLFELVNNCESTLPIFDFITNERSHLTKKLKIKQKDILIIEGLHALNPALISNSYNCFKIFVDVDVNYQKNNQVILNSRDLMLIRRIVRDYKFRNASIASTLEMWPRVCEGEKIYVLPYKHLAQIFLNSFTSYEPCFYKTCFKEIAKSVEFSTDFYRPFCDLNEKLQNFKSLKYIDVAFTNY